MKGAQLEPHPDQEEQPEARADRSGIIAAVVIAAVLLILIALHLVGAMSLHAS
jgi:hypothetical protein